MMKRIGFALLAGATLLAGAGWAVAQQHGVAPPRTSMAADARPVPFNLFRGNRIFLQARFNGQPTEVMLDSGASMTTLDRAYARSIGLPEGQKITGRGAGGIVEAELVSGVTLEIGGMRFEDMTVGVMDLSSVARGIGRPMNVVVGREFFNNAVVSIDWARSELRLSSPGTFSPRHGATAINLKRKGPFNVIPVAVAGNAPIDALLDVGNGGIMNLPKTYWGQRQELVDLPHSASMLGGVGGLHAARITTVPTVTLAGKTFRNVPTVLSEGGNDHDPEKMANVGIGFLKQFHVDLDLGNDRIYLAPREDAPPFDRERSGTRVDLLGDRLKVTFVAPGSPAATAGLKEGDEIVAVDGRKVTGAYYADSDWTRGAAGTRVKLDRADGSSVVVTLRDYY